MARYNRFSPAELNVVQSTLSTCRHNAGGVEVLNEEMAEVRKLQFKVRVGGCVLSSERTWKEVLQLKEVVKAFGRWDSQEKQWVVRVETLLKNLSAREFISMVFGDAGSKLIEEILKEDRNIRDSEAEKGLLLLLPNRLDTLCREFLRRCSKPDPRTVKGELVNYVAVDLGAAIDLMVEWGAEPEKAPEALLDFLLHTDPLLSGKQVRLVKSPSRSIAPPPGVVVIRERGVRGALAVFPRRLTSVELAELQDALSVEYYKQRIVESGVELVATKLRMANLISDRVVRIPYSLVPLLESFAERVGFRVVEEVRWPLEELRIHKVTFSLYSFQEEALEAWRRAGRRGAVVMPTGAGKTYVGLAAIAELKVPTLICVTTVELARQWAKRVSECLGMSAGLLAGGEKELRPVTVATYHSAARSIEEIYDKFGFVIYDEGHHLPAETFKEIALKVKAKFSLVLSATPERSDRNEALIYKVGGNPVYSTSYFKLVLRGLLAPLQLEKISVELDAEEANEYARVASSAVGPRQASELIKVAAKAKAKLRALKDIVSAEKGNILVFCQYLDQAEAAYSAVREVENRCALITGDTPKSERLRAFELFRQGLIRVIVSTTVLDEGVDVPDADVAIVLSGSGQVRQMVQRIGRVLRWTPGKVAKVYEVVAAGTIEEALSRSRSVFKLLSKREVDAALWVAQAVYSKMRDIVEEYEHAPRSEREKLLEAARAIYSQLAAEVAREMSLLAFWM